MARRGTPAPRAYASVIAARSVVTPRETARAITVAIMGPTQGAQSSPSPVPMSRPPPRPLRGVPVLTTRASGESMRSQARPTEGTSMVSPKRPSATIAAMRSHVAGRARACAAAAVASVTTVNDAVRPRTTPSGRSFPAATEVDRTMGSTGRTHGDTTVTTPARKTKRSNSGMFLPYLPASCVGRMLGGYVRHGGDAGQPREPPYYFIGVSLTKCVANVTGVLPFADLEAQRGGAVSLPYGLVARFDLGVEANQVTLGVYLAEAGVLLDNG